MSCQKDIVEIVAKQGGDYVVGLKGNQKTTYEQAKKYIEPQLDNLKYFKFQMMNLSSSNRSISRKKIVQRFVSQPKPAVRWAVVSA